MHQPSSSQSIGLPTSTMRINSTNSVSVFLSDDDNEEEDPPRGVSREDDYEDIYAHYADMEPDIYDSSTPYTMAKRRSSYNSKADDLQRNQSTSNQTQTSSSTKLGLFGSKKGAQDNRESLQLDSLHHRGVSTERALPLSSPAAKKFGWVPSTWAARLFVLVTLIEAAADISIEAVLLSRFREQRGSISANGGNLDALPVFLMVFGMAHVYQCFLAVDAVVNRNTILVFGLVLFNLALYVHTCLSP